MFTKILIANRGEIACRVIATAKKMGIATVAVYSEADANALHVREIGRSICVGGGPASESYLRIDAVLAGFAATEHGGGVLRFDHVLTRKAGQRRFVSLHIHMPGHWTLGEAERVRERLERALIEAVPGLHAGIQMLPIGVEPLTADLSEPVVPAGPHAH